ncbi:unnamed protein product [Porites evermanni]|uniref:TNFR-Cys domain-containing protein n=1 Tax=Porites evermanni TaxID=104178 RepID=A0ABN8SMZ9_9CNID|nr:unnamed protein product [Porites evermanni]
MAQSILLPSLLLSLMIAGVSPVCPDNDITVKDEALDKKCQTCPAGEGLSVNCGDVITPQTPIKCQSCVLGETYSGGNQAGACKICDPCDEYQETIKACTLTSNAVCGNCKHGAYFDNIVGRCKPCSPCCNDGKDILEPACKVPEVAANMRCNFVRSEKCAKVAVRNVSTSPSPTQHPTPSTAVISSPTTMPTTKKLEKPSVISASSGTSSRFIGIVAGVPTGAVVLAVLVLFCYCKKRRNLKTKTGLHTVENERHEVGLEQDLLIVATPEQESPYQSPMLPVEETCKNPLPIQDSQPPACSDSKDFKTSQSYKDPPSMLSIEDHKETAATPRKTGDEPDRV